MKKAGYDLIIPFVQEFDILVTECHQIWGSNRNSDSNTCAWKFEGDVVLAHRIPIDNKNNEKQPLRIHVSTNGAPRHHNYFVEKMLPFYEHRFELTGEGIIVHSGGGDASVGTVHAERIVNSKAVFRWVVENQRFFELIDHPKVVQLPIGICARELQEGLMHEFLRNMSRIAREDGGAAAATTTTSSTSDPARDLVPPSTCNYRYANTPPSGSVSIVVAVEDTKPNDGKRERLLRDASRHDNDDGFRSSHRRLAAVDGSTGVNASSADIVRSAAPHVVKHKGDRHSNSTLHNGTNVTSRKARPWLSGRRIDNTPVNSISSNNSNSLISKNSSSGTSKNSNGTATASHKARQSSRVRVKPPPLDFAGQPLPSDVVPAPMDAPQPLTLAETHK